MSLTQTLTYDTPANFSFDAAKVDFPVGGPATLKLGLAATTPFSQDFASDVGFTYDSSKAEFVGGVVRQKAQATTEAYSRGAVAQGPSQRPANAYFGATYTTDINRSWGDGSSTTATSGTPPTVSGGKLVMASEDVRWVRYSGLSVPAGQAGAIRFKYTPNYSGSPVGDYRAIVGLMKADGVLQDCLFLWHYKNTDASPGALFLLANNAAGTQIVNKNFGQFLPTSGQEYEFELDYDLSGDIRLFIDGVQFGTSGTSSGTVSGLSILKIGTDYANTYKSNFRVDSVILYSAVQHTAGYTPGYTTPETDYAAAVSSYAVFTYTNVIDSLGVPTIVGDTNTPKFIVNGWAYFGGSWQASSDTYATAMTKTDWVAQYAGFPSAQLGSGLTVKVVFQDTNAAASVTSVALNVNEHNYAETSVTLPLYTYTGPGTGLRLDSTSSTETGTPRYTLNSKYWNGSALVVSDGSYAQANSKAQIIALITALGGIPIPVNTLDISVIFPSGIVQNNVDQIDFTVSGYFYDTTNPTITSPPQYLDNLYSLLESATKPAGSELKYCLSLDGVPYWWSGSAWSVSSGAYAQSNTRAEIATNLSSLTAEQLGASFRLVVFLHSDTGVAAPSLVSNTYSYDYFSPPSTAPNKCYCYMRIMDVLGLVPTTASLRLENDVAFWNGTYLELPYRKTVSFDVNGYAEIYANETGTELVTFSLTYTDPNDNKTKTVNFEDIAVPDQTSLDLSTVLVVA